MGTDKALLELGGKTFLERALDAVAGAERIVLVGPEREVAGPLCVWTRENPPGGGPVAAIAAGLDLATSDRVVVLAVDHPLVQPAVIARLLAGVGDRDGAMVVGARADEQPLVGAYRRARLTARLEDTGKHAGAAIKDLISGLDLVRIEDQRAARDCDSADDLAALRHELHGSRG